MNEVCMRQTFAEASSGSHVRALGGTLVAQVAQGGAAATIQGSNFPGQESSWVTLGTVDTATPLEFSTAFAYLRAVAQGACEIVVSASQSAGTSLGAALSGGALPTTALNFDILSEGLALSATTAANQRTQLDPSGAYPDIMIDNRGSADLYVIAGDATAAANANCQRIPAGHIGSFYKGTATHIAYVAASGTIAFWVKAGRGQ